MENETNPNHQILTPRVPGLCAFWEDHVRAKPRAWAILGCSEGDMGGHLTASEMPDGSEEVSRTSRKRPDLPSCLDCYWVGSLDVNFLGNEGVFH